MDRLLRIALLALVCLGTVLVATARAAHPGTSLNDIPVADVIDWRTFEIKTWVHTAELEEPEWWGAVNFGILDYAEVGVYGILGPRDDAGGDVRFFGKFVYPLGEDRPSIGAGLDNLTGDEDDNGNIDPYLVVTHDFGPVRGTLGYSLQDDDEAFFAGIDTSFDFLEMPITAGLDVTQTDDGDEWLVSAGFEYQLPLELVLETWYTWTTVDDAEDALTIRLNWVITF
ncbi:MAG: hypothetical protein JW889_08730 [Verrucomicrobia bacterium]|nr:hypothetical protein [Verrucomicrobiota bacterium]